MKIQTLAIFLGCALSLPVMAQEESEGDKVQVHGSVQTDFLVPEKDAKIGTEDTSDPIQNNTYVNLSVISKYVEGGLRFEYTDHPMPGFEKDFAGYGLPNVFVKGKLKGAEITLGDIYEQFGSGFILRTYEERSLGIDNSIRGGRIKVNAVKGLRMTALGGIQRRYWKWNTDSRLAGADVEVDLNEYINKFIEKDITWTWGASWVMKNEEKPREDAPLFVPGTMYALNVPQNVHAFDFRTNLHVGDFSLLAEGAWKTEDPSASNAYTFSKGNAMMVSASYSRNGLSVLAQMKRSEDMSFRSQRGMTGLSTFINNMPAFAYQHTYALAALYPYATQYANINQAGTTLVPGEWAYQAEVAYNFKRKTALGGKYGTKVKVNFSHVRGLDTKRTDAINLPGGEAYNGMMGTKGYKTSFFGQGELYYQDVNLQIEKKFTKAFKLNAMYMHQIYNQPIVENHGNKMYNNIIVLDGRYQFNDRITLRMEYQHLFAKVDKGDNSPVEFHENPGDWDYIMAELTVLPYLMFSVSDQIGKPFFGDGYHAKEHYYMGMATFTYGAHRLNAGYGRTRAGYNCSGGVCRWVPASKGFQFSYNYSF